LSLDQGSLPRFLLLLERYEVFISLKEFLLRLEELILEDGELLPAALVA